MTTGFNNRQVTFDGKHIIVDGYKVLHADNESVLDIVQEIVNYLEAGVPVSGKFYTEEEYQEAIDEAREDAYDEGYYAGSDNRQESAWQEGYDEGYDEGYQDGKYEIGE